MANKKIRKVRAHKSLKVAAHRPQPKRVVSQNRSEGLRLFRIAGRPTKEQFILVYGQNGPKMTWRQRAAAGVPAKKFQAALAAKERG